MKRRQTVQAIRQIENKNKGTHTHTHTHETKTCVTKENEGWERDSEQRNQNRHQPVRNKADLRRHPERKKAKRASNQTNTPGNRKAKLQKRPPRLLSWQQSAWKQHTWVWSPCQEASRRRKRQPTTVFLLRKPHGQRSFGELQLTGLRRVGHNSATKQFMMMETLHRKPKMQQ